MWIALFPNNYKIKLLYLLTFECKSANKNKKLSTFLYLREYSELVDFLH